MDWKRLLSYISGSINEAILSCNEYLVAENRILKRQIKGRILFSHAERKTLAEIGKRLGKKALEEIATIVIPATILFWHRQWIVRMAQENRDWGYNRIVGNLGNLGYRVSDNTVGNILKRNGLAPAPVWKEFIRTHRDLLFATDFFTAEVWTLNGLVTYYDLAPLKRTLF